MNTKRSVIVIILWLAARMSSLIFAATENLQKDQTGVTIQTQSGLTRLEVWNEQTIRVLHTPTKALPQTKSLAVIARPQNIAWKIQEIDPEILLITSALHVRVEKTTGRVWIMDAKGVPILTESANGTTMTPATVGGSATYQVKQQFEFDPQEALYGLGQHQQGIMNYSGSNVHLQQENREVAVPVMLSSKGYAILWDNPAVTDVNMGKAAQNQKQTLEWSSEAGSAVDYYVMYGPQLDQAISAYRQLTGSAPMFAKWTWGFWQCKERYQTQEELLGVLAEYRKRQIPFDGIIQDWQYWKSGQWGSHEFDPARYPDPAAMVKKVHDSNAHIIISVWPRFDLETAPLAELEKASAVYPPVYKNVYPEGQGKWYDPYNPKGRQLYWNAMQSKLGKLGFDGWWLDACEAELGGQWGQMRDLKTGAGAGAEVYNAYPLMHTTGVYQGQRVDIPDKRIFILARSAYAGQQRNGVVTWSGDIQGSWEVFAAQIPAGLNFCASGIPYWNTDIGGFFGGDPANAGYQELFTRWFEFGTFCPMFRVHGTGKGKEMWRFDEPTQKILADYDQLRYHLLPYIYSVAWQVTSKDYTMMRPLVMDFRNDTKVFNIADQYMFGPAILVNPVIKAKAENRDVYLPKDAKWFDFWTGQLHDGGQTVDAKAPIETMPLFVKAGSIIPYGPAVQYANEKDADPIELRIYPGADGQFTLYEDEGDNYNYEKGAYAEIPINWNEKARELTIGDRKGKFAGMVEKRTFKIVNVQSNHGAGIALTQAADKEVKYDGKAVKIQMPIVSADITGTWKAEFDTQIGLQKYTFTLTQNGTRVSGKALAEVEDEKYETELTEGKLDGDTISFVEPLDFQGMQLHISYSGKVNGDEIKLTRQVGDVATEELVMKREKSNAPAAKAAPQRPQSPWREVVLGPDDKPAFEPAPKGFDVIREGIARGTVETVEYDSKTVGNKRKMMIYTPPGYSKDTRYPVLYLLHGIGGDEAEWSRGATPQVILDNLYADKKLAPMIVVMPNGRAQPNDRAEGDVFRSAPAFAKFERDLLNDVIPFVESKYSVKTGPENRALAGLSMGGGQSLNFGLGHLDTFAWVGGFSSAPNTKAPQELAPEPDKTAKQLKLLWISCGDKDGLMYISQGVHAYMKENKVPHIWHVDSGGHDFTVWKNDLYLFSQQLFR